MHGTNSASSLASIQNDASKLKPFYQSLNELKTVCGEFLNNV